MPHILSIREEKSIWTDSNEDRINRRIDGNNKTKISPSISLVSVNRSSALHSGQTIAMFSGYSKHIFSLSEMTTRILLEGNPFFAKNNQISDVCACGKIVYCYSIFVTTLKLNTKSATSADVSLSVYRIF